jgi:alpha-tubulin suppressor-like RCC1 family protein
MGKFGFLTVRPTRARTILIPAIVMAMASPLTAASAALPVTSAVSMSVPSSTETGLTFALSGYAYPARAGRVVEVQQREGTAWTEAGRTTTSADGHYSLRTSVPREETLTYRTVSSSWHGDTGCVSGEHVVSAHDPNMRLTPSTAITAESVAAAGKLPGVSSRLVQVQLRSKNSWVTLAQTTTSSTGSYATSFPAPAIGSYAVRALAQQVRTSGKLHGQVVTDAKTLRVVAQTVSLSLPKTLVQAAAVTATAKFAPARPGRAVALQVLESGVWTPLATGSQSSNGTASFTLTAATPGTYSYRAWTAAASGAPAFAGPARTLTSTPAATATTVSTGGSTTVRLPNVTVVAAGGAVAAGQTLTLARSTVPRTETPTVLSLIGGPISLSSSQGQPQGPVTITFTLAPGQLGAGRQPLLLHQEAGGEWLPELAVLSPDGQTVSVTVDHFSFFDLVDRAAYAAYLLTGNRTNAAVDNCGPPPSWVDPIIMPMPINDLNAALWACPAIPNANSDPDTFVLHVVNNRGYLQELKISGAVVDTTLSFPTSLQKTVETALARLKGSDTNASEVFLPGGASALLVLHRPSGPAQPVRIVDIAATPSKNTVALGLLWTALNKLSQKAKVGSAVVDCAFLAYKDFTDPSVQGDFVVFYKSVDKCLGPLADAVGLILLPALSVILTVDGIGYQLSDVVTQEKYPAHLLFTEAGNSAPLAVTTTLPGGVVDQPYAATLSATGGTAPLTWSVTSGSLPAGLSLSASGSISGTPSALGSASFTVAVRDSTGATASAALTLNVVDGSIRSGTISTGQYHSCGVTTAGAAKCWGDNAYGGLGDGSVVNSSTPVGVLGLGSGVASVTAGLYDSCAVTTAGAVKCWGHNALGELGNGTTTDSSTPVDVVGLNSGVARVSVGQVNTCAVTTGGAVKCWGFNVDGQLGDGTTTSSSTPVGVVGLGSGGAAVSVGDYHSCAVTTGGAVKCWGENAWGSLGDGTTPSNVPVTHNVPVGVVGLGSGVSSVTAGLDGSCAVTTAGAVKCWGLNIYGELGNGTTTNSSTPVDVLGLGSGVAAVSAGGGHTCALTTGGAGKCWGYNPVGELGDGSTTNSSTPVDVVGLGSGGAAISAGGYHSCVETTGGAVKCWGSNGYGQLGDGTTTSSAIPVAVTGLP